MFKIILVKSVDMGWVHICNATTIKRLYTIGRHPDFKTKWVEVADIDGELVYSDSPYWPTIKSAVRDLTGNILQEE